MASVVSTQLVSDRPDGNGFRYVRYRFDLLDNLNGNHVEYIGPKYVEDAFDTDADMLALSPIILASKADQEVSEIQGGMESGEDGLHVDMGGFFEKADLLWLVWDDAFVRIAEYFWGLENIVEIIPFKDSWGRVSSTDKRNALGITNQLVSDMNADMQIATDIKASIDAYVPHYSDDMWS